MIVRRRVGHQNARTELPFISIASRIIFLTPGSTALNLLLSSLAFKREKRFGTASDCLLSLIK